VIANFVIVIEIGLLKRREIMDLQPSMLSL